MKIKTTLSKLHILWSFYVPEILTYIALIWTIITTSRDFFGHENVTQIMSIYFSITALSTALASTLFSYQKCKKGEEQEQLTKIGQLFLYSSISLIMALLVAWLSFNIRTYIGDLTNASLLNTVTNLLFSFNYMFFLYSIVAFHTGIVRLERHLFFEVKEDII